MKKYLVGLLIISTAVSLYAVECNVQCATSCECEITSRTFLSVRPQFQLVSPEMVSGFRHKRLHAREDGIHAAGQAVVFGSQSTNPQAIARYFFPNCNTSLIVDEHIDAFGGQDLLADHFNIYTKNGNFRSQISIAPKQSVIGLGLHYRQSFWRDEVNKRGLWCSASFPIERVRNKLHFRETVINDGGGANYRANFNVYPNMTAALEQSDWLFGKFDTGCHGMSKTGVADIELRLGYEWLEDEPCHLESYLGVVIPTGNKYDGKHLFYPIVGNGHHLGVIFGSTFGVNIWKNEETDRCLRLEWATNGQYLFRNIQCRSFDLQHKPWSRYIELYANQAQAQAAANLAANGQTLLAAHFATPGIDILSGPMYVTPGFSFNMITAFVYTNCAVQGELGYNFYARRAECVKLVHPWQTGPAIKHILGDGQTNPIRDITGNGRLEATTINIALANYQQNEIQASDLDLASASHPCMLSYNLYATVGYNWDEIDYPTFAFIGTSYEFSNSNNAVLDRWTVWGKIGASF